MARHSVLAMGAIITSLSGPRGALADLDQQNMRFYHLAAVARLEGTLNG